jgi:hypothetical protein
LSTTPPDRFDGIENLFFHDGCSYYSLKSTVGKAAKLTGIGRGHGPIFRPWRALSRCTGRVVRRRELTESYLRAGAPRTHRRYDRDTRTTGHYIVGKRILITGGTGSLGCALISRLITDRAIERIIIYSRDEQRMSWRCLRSDCTPHETHSGQEQSESYHRVERMGEQLLVFRDRGRAKLLGLDVGACRINNPTRVHARVGKPTAGPQPPAAPQST